MERREFLRTSALLLGGMAVGCNRSAGPSRALDVFPGGEEYVAGVDTYFAFGTSAAAATSVEFEHGAGGGGTRIGPLPSTYQRYMRPEAPPSPQGVNVVDVRFPKAGLWLVRARTQAVDGNGVGTTVIEVRDSSRSRVSLPGDPAVDVATPTVRDPRSIDPICTRAPACPFHAVSLSDALRAREPIALFVGSPKFCSSRTCGPNLEELIDVSKKSQTTFIHAEVYVDDAADTIRQQRFTPVFRRWRLPSEPWLFLIGRNGRIASRFEGPVTAPQIRSALTRAF